MTDNKQNRPSVDENQLQAINHRAKAIEQETGLSVVRCHLGNPTGPQFEPANQLLSKYFAERGNNPKARGYADVAGDPDLRKVIALSLTKINRLPEGSINGDNIVAAPGGTGALNVALSIHKDLGDTGNSTVLVADPFYPPWKNIAERLQCDFATFPLRRQDDWLLNEQVLTDRITELNREKPGQPIALIYHYPNNPTGKALTEKEAQDVGTTLNHLTHKFSNLHLVQEDLYLSTTAPELGIYTPLPYLDETAKQRTVWLHSPSKMGLQQDRGAVVAAFNPDVVKKLRKAASFSTLGTSTPALMATAATLLHIAQGGVDAVDAKGSDPDNHRFVTARFYQERLDIMYKALDEAQKTAHVTLMEDKMPQGAYYLYPSFDCLKDKDIPQELLPAFHGKTKFEDANDVATALENASLMGLRPVTIAPGTLFTETPGSMSLRISTIEDTEKLRDAANTFKGLLQKTLGVDLHAKFEDQSAMQEKWGMQLQARAKPPLRWDRKINKEGEVTGREFNINR